MEVLGILGFTIGALGFLTSGVKNCATFVHDLRKYRDIIELMWVKVQSYQSLLVRWTMMWNKEGRPYASYIYEYCWGAVGFKRISVIINMIKKKARQLEDIFDGSEFRKRTLIGVLKGVPSKKDWEKWRCLLRTGQHLTRETFQRVAGALYQNESLEKRVREMQALVEMLGKDSENYWMKQRGVHEAKNDEMAKEMQQLPSRLARAKEFEQFIQNISSVTYAKPNQQRTWHLVLESPWHPSPIIGCSRCIECFEHGMEIRLLLFEERSSSARVHIAHFPPCDDQPPIRLAKRKMHIVSRHGMSSKSRSLMSQEDLYQERRYRSYSAVAIVNSSLLLAKTDFMLNSELSRLSYIQDDNTYSGRVLRFTVKRLDSHRRPYLRLGTILAELCIGRSIKLAVYGEAPDEVEFRIIREPKGPPRSKTQLIREVSRLSMCSTYRDAVQACFDLDCIVLNRGGKYRLEDTTKGIEKILKP
jgi:hypothetical protein